MSPDASSLAAFALGVSAAITGVGVAAVTAARANGYAAALVPTPSPTPPGDAAASRGGATQGRSEDKGKEKGNKELAKAGKEEEAGVSKNDLADVLKQMQAQQQPAVGPGGIPEDASALELFCADLTDEARKGNLDPLVGRHPEMRRIIHILCRRCKNNPCLLGEPGVGKTAIIEGLAARLVAGDVPPALKDCKLLELDTAALAAGCAMPGDYEERMKRVVSEICAEENSGKVILFVDDIHQIVPQPPNMVNDGGAILKPALGRGQLRCIGCSSVDKYKKTIEQDPGLERRFQVVNVDEPTSQGAVSVLRGLRRRYEEYHNVSVSESALLACVELGKRYVTGRRLPDKAVDLMDEAAANVSMEVSTKNSEFDIIDRQIAQLTREKFQVMERKGRSGAKKLLAGSASGDGKPSEQSEVAMQEEILSKGMIDELESELKGLREQRETAAKEMAATDAGNASAPPAAKDAKGAIVAKAPLAPSRRVSNVVQVSDVAKVVSRWTGIPASKLNANEKEKLLTLDDQLHGFVVGQHHAVVAVTQAIQRSRMDVAPMSTGPIASFMFLGPTGVGKTELAKALATTLFESAGPSNLVRFDMSEYMEKHAVARLIGAPPGYLGYDEGGLLTDTIRRRPYSVLLFDEVEKAHVDVLNVLLQLLDDGMLTDSKGVVTSFTNCVVIMTSNLGSSEIMKDAMELQARGLSVVDSDEAERDARGDTPQRRQRRERVMEAVRGHFRPELINRVDDFVIFDPLSPSQIVDVVRMQTKRIAERAVAQKKLKGLTFTDDAINRLAEFGYEPMYGARPVRRILRVELLQPLSHAMLLGQFTADDEVHVSAAEVGVFGAISSPIAPVRKRRGKVLGLFGGGGNDGFGGTAGGALGGATGECQGLLTLSKKA